MNINFAKLVSRSAKLILFLSFLQTYCVQKGIVIVPVADLVGQPLESFYHHMPVHNAYGSLVYAPYSTHYDACPRVHQLLYHEMVDIVKKKGNEVEIDIPQVFYQTAANPQPQTLYWTLAKNILPLDPKKHDLNKLPQPVNFKTNRYGQNNIVSLLEPFYEPGSHTTFSAGTRFVLCEHQPGQQLVAVYYLHPKKQTIAICHIPKNKLHFIGNRTNKERVADFITALRRWTQQSNGIIPYVWGGCSFTQTMPKNSFTVEHKPVRGKVLGHYMRPEHNSPAKSGFDCSGIIVRSAQIAGLPYFFKNTYTITQQLPALKHNEQLKEGDLIWIRGHIYIVADTHKQTVIEAHAYDGGYGKVHEIPIAKVFKGVETFAQLTDIYRYKKPLERLNHNGDVYQRYNEIKLLKFGGQWA